MQHCVMDCVGSGEQHLVILITTLLDFAAKTSSTCTTELTLEVASQQHRWHLEALLKI